MKFVHRAAILAAVTLFAGTLVQAAPTEVAATEPEQQVQQINAQEHHIVPMPLDVAGALPKQEAVASTIEAANTGSIAFPTLIAAVDAQDMPAAASDELHCLAVGVYYEAKGEPLAGQLAVAEVLLDRTTSGRFPHDVCGVLKQRGQFSFVRGGVMPTPPANAQWRKAMAVAQVAQKDLWESPVDGALYFHARYVSPGWKRPVAGKIGNHVFYR